MDIRQRIEHTKAFPYHSRKPKDAAELAACAVLGDMTATNRVGDELEFLSVTKKRQLVKSLAAIIRTVMSKTRSGG